VTAVSISSMLSTIGTMTPRAPMSVAFWMSPSVAAGMRMKGIAGASRHAQIIRAASVYVSGLCCISIQMKSKPAFAIAQ
jgi:hypothetical protein